MTAAHRIRQAVDSLRPGSTAVVDRDDPAAVMATRDELETACRRTSHLKNQHYQESERLRKALQVLADAAVVWAPHPLAALLTADGDLDWSLASLYLQRVLDGSTADQALDDVVDARTARDTATQRLQQRPTSPPLVQQAVDEVTALVDYRLNTGKRLVVTTNTTAPVLAEVWGSRLVDRLLHRATVAVFAGASRRVAW